MVFCFLYGLLQQVIPRYIAWIGTVLRLYPLLIALPFSFQGSLVLTEPLLPGLVPFG